MEERVVSVRFVMWILLVPPQDPGHSTLGHDDPLGRKYIVTAKNVPEQCR